MTTLLVHAAATLSMAGVIWIIQLVHYPLFGLVGTSGYALYHEGHTRRITWVVGPGMVVEAATAVLLVLRVPDGVPAWEPVAGLVAVGLLWLSTWLVQVPLHGRLGTGFDVGAHRALVRTNWFRTALWSARAVLVLVMVGQAAG
jgi:hypothetical protein